jgi:dipeptidyl aminopeptidase/acylaminoacyl peptidase
VVVGAYAEERSHPQLTRIFAIFETGSMSATNEGGMFRTEVIYVFTRKAVAACLLFGLAVLSCWGQSKHTITVDDILNLRDVSDAQISPNGKWVAFVVGAEGGWSGPRDPHIWIVSTDGKSVAHPFAASAQGETSPRWSPDGRFLAFLSKRPETFKPQDLAGEPLLAPFAEQALRSAKTSIEKGPSKTPGKSTEEKKDADTGHPDQIWIMPVDGGEALPLTHTIGSVQAFFWSPDGSMIAFTVKDPLTAEEKARQAREDDRIFVDHEFKYARLWLLDFKAGAAKQLLAQDLNVNDVAWSPDGKQLALRTSKTPRMVDYWWRNQLILVDRANPHLIRTLDDQASAMDVRWSPDGQVISYGQFTPSGISARPVVLSLSGGAPRTMDDDYSGTVWSAQWRPESHQLIAEALEGTTAKFVTIDPQSRKTATLASLNAEGPEFTMSADGRKIAFIAQTPESPSNVWVMDSGESPVQLTHLHPEVATWNLGAVREITWKNEKDGKTIYGVLVTPPGFTQGKKYPTVVQVHGGPEWAWWTGWLGSWHEWAQMLASHGYVVLLPDPRGSDGQGWKFAEAVHDDWGGMDFEDIMSGVDHLVSENIADPDNLGIGGWSYGGFMSAWAVTHTNRFKAAVIGAAVTDLVSFSLTSDVSPSFPDVYFDGPPFRNWQRYAAHSPLTFLVNARTPSLILHGAADPRVPPSQGLEFYNGLQLLGVPSQLVLYPREPHGISERAHQADVLTRVLAWYERYLKRD